MPSVQRAQDLIQRAVKDCTRVEDIAALFPNCRIVWLVICSREKRNIALSRSRPRLCPVSERKINKRSGTLGCHRAPEAQCDGIDDII